MVMHNPVIAIRFVKYCCTAIIFPFVHCLVVTKLLELPRNWESFSVRKVFVFYGKTALAMYPVFVLYEEVVWANVLCGIEAIHENYCKHAGYSDSTLPMNLLNHFIGICIAAVLYTCA